MIHVIAVIAAKPGQREAILTHFRANVPAVRAEKGCIEYGAAVDCPTPLPAQQLAGEDVVIVPAGAQHKFTNPSKARAVTFSVYAPPAYPE